MAASRRRISSSWAREASRNCWLRENWRKGKEKRVCKWFRVKRRGGGGGLGGESLRWRRLLQCQPFAAAAQSADISIQKKGRGSLPGGRAGRTHFLLADAQPLTIVKPCGGTISCSQRVEIKGSGIVEYASRKKGKGLGWVGLGGGGGVT
jgi:hypothetical protein